MKKRIANIEVYNKYYNGEDKVERVGRAFVSGDSDKVFAEFILNHCWWVIENATGECELTLHINPSKIK